MLSQVRLGKTMTVQSSTEKFLSSIKTLPYWVAKNNHFYLDVNVKTSLEHDSDRCYLTYDIKIQVSDLEFLDEVWDKIETEQEYQELDKFIENNPIGTLKVTRYNVSPYVYQDYDGIVDILNHTDGVDFNLGRIPLYFTPPELREAYSKGLMNYRSEPRFSQIYELDRKGEIIPGSYDDSSPSKLLEEQFVNYIWHLDNCKINHTYRGHNLGLKAISKFVETFIQDGDIVATIPSPIDGSNIDQRKERNWDKTSDLLRRYWRKLGLSFYCPHSNILWGYGESVRGLEWYK